MPIVPLYGHTRSRTRLLAALRAGSLPSALLITGPRGTGKQRLALWLAQALVCEAAPTGGGTSDRPGDHAAMDTAAVPCGRCRACRMVLDLQHPDVYWFYPRPRREGAVTADDVMEDYEAAWAERREQHGLYARPPGTEGLHIATIRTIVQRAALTPALARVKTFIVGDAERMVSQEGADQAANAFLKLLEEPPADTRIVLTSSEPGALLPTIRSRVVPVRPGPLADNDVRAFVRDPAVEVVLRDAAVPATEDERVAIAAGAPGALLDAGTRAAARAAAERLLRAAAGPGAARYATALAQGSSGARGAFADALAALNVLLHERADAALRLGDAERALAATRAVDAVAVAQGRADGNVMPQLVAASLLRELARLGP